MFDFIFGKKKEEPKENGREVLTFPIRRYQLSTLREADVLFMFENPEGRAEVLGCDQEIITFTDGPSEVDILTAFYQSEDPLYEDGEYIEIKAVRLNRNT